MMIKTPYVVKNKCSFLISSLSFDTELKTEVSLQRLGQSNKSQESFPRLARKRAQAISIVPKSRDLFQTF